jgi:hypothetical protein
MLGPIADMPYKIANAPARPRSSSIRTAEKSSMTVLSVRLRPEDMDGLGQACLERKITIGSAPVCPSSKLL